MTLRDIIARQFADDRFARKLIEYNVPLLDDPIQTISRVELSRWRGMGETSVNRICAAIEAETGQPVPESAWDAPGRDTDIVRAELRKGIRRLRAMMDEMEDRLR